MNLKVGDKAPNFNLPDQDGKKHKLSDYKEAWLLIYFYPKDNTPGCTTESCSLRDSFPNLRKLDLEVIGVSPDSIESHRKFADRFDLPFTLLSDTEKTMLNDYEVWAEKSMYGKTYWGVLRTSFLIAPGGKIAKIYEKVKPADHADEIAKDLKRLQRQ
jgi:thioredoxin-dependent peroxiredoxin